MIVAYGLHTRKEYARGKRKADVMRQLHEEYSSFEPARGDKRKERERNPIYQEPLAFREEE